MVNNCINQRLTIQIERECVTTTPVMSRAPIYQIEATGLLPKHSDRKDKAYLSPFPALAQCAQPASSAVVLSYMLLGKYHRGRGARQLRVKSSFWILSKPVSVCFPCLWCTTGLSRATHCKTTAEKVRVQRTCQQNPQMTHVITQPMTRESQLIR